MMTLGLIVSLLVTFFLLLSFIKYFSSENEINIKDNEKIFYYSLFGSVAKKNNIIIFGTTLGIIIASVIGISKLEVENSFINYFDKETEILQRNEKN